MLVKMLFNIFFFFLNYHIFENKKGTNDEEMLNKAFDC